MWPTPVRYLEIMSLRIVDLALSKMSVIRLSLTSEISRKDSDALDIFGACTGLMISSPSQNILPTDVRAPLSKQPRIALLHRKETAKPLVMGSSPPPAASPAIIPLIDHVHIPSPATLSLLCSPIQISRTNLSSEPGDQTWRDGESCRSRTCGGCCSRRRRERQPRRGRWGGARRESS